MSRSDRSHPAAFSWRDGRLSPARDLPHETLLAADSWLVNEGSTRALDLHERRFEHAVQQQEPATIDTNGFWQASMRQIPATGAWFPRVELHRRADSSRFWFTLRPAPERTKSVVLATAVGPDQRTRPTIKGPDLEAMRRLRADAHERGADESVICSPEGHVIEGAYSSILWWEEDVLCAPAPELPRVDSVTARSMIAVATASGIDVHYESVTPEDLDGREIWVLNALHGIRIATGWIDGPQPAEQPGRLALWRDRLWRLSRPIDTLRR